jgi:hypothetical protein
MFKFVSFDGNFISIHKVFVFVHFSTNETDDNKIFHQFVTMNSLNKVTDNQVLQEMMIEMGIFNSGIHNRYEILRMVRSCFGFDPSTVALVWNMLVERELLFEYARLKYLLYMCCFMKTYLTYEQYRVMFGVSYPTFKSWVWYFGSLVSKLEIVSCFAYMPLLISPK